MHLFDLMVCRFKILDILNYFAVCFRFPFFVAWQQRLTFLWSECWRTWISRSFSSRINSWDLASASPTVECWKRFRKSVKSFSWFSLLLSRIWKVLKIWQSVAIWRVCWSEEKSFWRFLKTFLRMWAHLKIVGMNRQF